LQESLYFLGPSYVCAFFFWSFVFVFLFSELHKPISITVALIFSFNSSRLQWTSSCFVTDKSSLVVVGIMVAICCHVYYYYIPEHERDWTEFMWSPPTLYFLL
jgi:hypothetical protein